MAKRNAARSKNEEKYRATLSFTVLPPSERIASGAFLVCVGTALEFQLSVRAYWSEDLET